MTLRGKLLDAETLLPVEKATVHHEGGGVWVSGADGDFVLHFTAGKQKIVVRHLTYRTEAFVLEVRQDTFVRILLSPLVRQLEESVVRERKDRGG